MVGDTAVWNGAQRIAHVDLPAVPADRPGPITRNGVPFLDLPPADRSWSIGEMSPAAGRAAAQWLEHAAHLALEGLADAVVFAPVNKQAMIRAGYPIRDEYDLCARLARVDDHDEMNVSPHPANPSDLLWVARATGHAALREVPALLTVESVLRTIRLAHR
ncbi:MAG: 4-hydroxythreonine-4-phosphate dehydrogenase PdxA, partial [Armatimonadota bacterium]